MKNINLMGIILPELEQKSRLGFYVHIPFCPHICPYCDFVKTSKFTLVDIKEYFKKLEETLDFFIQTINTSEIRTVTLYFGGGTPGIISPKYYEVFIKKLSDFFDLEEVTIETNPFTNYKKFFEEYKKIGINRITLGAQSLCQETLDFLGRRHSPQNILENIRWAKEIGFEQVQVDLIYGLKEGIRTLTVQEEIQILLQHGATGISAYGLTLEKRTLFADTNNADDNVAQGEYELIVETCLERGLRQIETSNFSFFQSKHNQLYWNGYPYIGLGTGAHGLLLPTKEQPFGLRYKMGSAIQQYEKGNDILKYTQAEDLEKNFKIVYEESRSKEMFFQEMIFTLLRTEKGIPLSWLKQNLNEDFCENIFMENKKIKRGLHEKRLYLNSEFVGLTAKEKIVGDLWALEFILCLEKYIC